MKTLRVVTYNIHKCRGLDQRIRPARIVEVLKELDADLIALQEVVSHRGHKSNDQARIIADGLELQYAFGETRRMKRGRYGNAILSRFPVSVSQNYDISAPGREPRGCLRADIQVGPSLLHIFNVHLGTAYFERRHQGRRLFNDRILNHDELTGTRIILGDFNEWVGGLASDLLRSHLESADIRKHLGRRRTYPGVLPFLHLDHIYFDPALKLHQMKLHRTKLSLIASDHLPLVADFHTAA
jgi:endonuclease/exonuclease/phosphatase family metal-dependent hydrolase